MINVDSLISVANILKTWIQPTKLLQLSLWVAKNSRIMHLGGNQARKKLNLYPKALLATENTQLYSQLSYGWEDGVGTKCEFS